MSRSSKSNLIVRDNRVELLLGLSESADIVKDNLGFFMLLGAFANANFNGINDRKRGIPVIDDFDCIIYSRHNHFRHLRPIIAIHGLRAAAPDKQPPGHGHVVQRDLAISRAAADDEITVHGHVFQLHIVRADQDVAFHVLVIAALGNNVSANDVGENLRELGAGDVVLRGKHLATTVNVIRTDHGADVWHRPIRDFTSIRELRKLGLGIRIVVQLQRSRHHGHGFLPRDGCIRGHTRIAATIVRSHLDSHCNIFKVPLVLGNVGFRVAAKRAVDDRRHFCARHIAIGVDDGRAFAVKQSFIHGGTHGIRVPRSTVKVAEVGGFSGCACRRCADRQRQARCNRKNHCEDSFFLHVEYLLESGKGNACAFPCAIGD